MMRSTFRSAGVACLWFFCLVPQAYAHASLVSSDPRNGATMGSPPKDITITFSEALRDSESSIRVYDISGKQMNSGNIVKSSSDKTVVTASLPALPSGTYKVKWNAVCLCEDHHATQGVLIFLVR